MKKDQEPAKSKADEKKDVKPPAEPVVRVPPTTEEELERARKIGAMP